MSDRLLLEFFNQADTRPASRRDKWWCAGAIVVITMQFAFGCALLWFI
jgi:hypothetical protein